MNTLHPVMQQALAPFVPPKSRTYTAPNARGVFVYEWNTDCDEPIVCHLEYTRACRGSFERGGLQIEPDEPESITLGAAYLLDVDIFYLLSNAQITEIESAALLDISSSARDDYDDRNED